MSALAPALQAYFTDRLIGQRAASPTTTGAYKPTFRLLLTFASKRLGKTPAALDIAELDAPLIAAFLDHLERSFRRVRTSCRCRSGWGTALLPSRSTPTAITY